MTVLDIIMALEHYDTKIEVVDKGIKRTVFTGAALELLSVPTFDAMNVASLYIKKNCTLVIKVNS